MRYPYEMLSYLYPTVSLHVRAEASMTHAILDVVQCSHTRGNAYRYVVVVSLLQGNLQCIHGSRFVHSYSFADF